MSQHPRPLRPSRTDMLAGESAAKECKGRRAQMDDLYVRRNGGGELLTTAVALSVAAVAAILCWRYGAGAGVNALITLGMLQAPAVTMFRSEVFAIADDAAAGVLFLWALVEVFRKRSRIDIVSLAVLGGCAMLAAGALARSADAGIGVAQARQVALPLTLIFTGIVLRDRIRWTSVLRWVALLALLAACYAIAEWVTGGPLLNPAYYWTEYQGVDPGTFRDGLPSAYVSDTPSGTLVRAGGPFLNPPSLGFFLASGVIAALILGHLLPLVAFAAALWVAFARAGMVISGLATVVAWAWQILGKWVSVTLALAAGGTLTLLFLRQGNSASHAEGLVSGTQYALMHPQGQGFGGTGYQAAVATGAANNGIGTESLLGLYFVWMGLPALLLAMIGLFRLGTSLVRQRIGAVQAWAAIGVLVGAAASETASALAATAFLWLLLGATLAEHDLQPEQLAPGAKRFGYFRGRAPTRVMWRRFLPRLR